MADTESEIPPRDEQTIKSLRVIASSSSAELVRVICSDDSDNAYEVAIVARGSYVPAFLAFLQQLDAEPDSSGEPPEDAALHPPPKAVEKPECIHDWTCAEDNLNDIYCRKCMASR